MSQPAVKEFRIEHILKGITYYWSQDDWSVNFEDSKKWKSRSTCETKASVVYRRARGEIRVMRGREVVTSWD